MTAPNFFSVVTNAGDALIADAIANNTPVSIFQMAFGDGNGQPTTPVPTQTALAREVYRVGVESVTRDNVNQNWVIVRATIPAPVGPFTIREVGIYTQNGTLLAVSNFPEQYKAVPNEGAFSDVTVEIVIIVSNSAQLQISFDSSTYVTETWVLNLLANMRQPWITVDSATTTAPPANPTFHQIFVIPAGATGAWAGHTNKMARWFGGEIGWSIVDVPITTVVAAADTRKYFQRTGSGWARFHNRYGVDTGNANAMVVDLGWLPASYDDLQFFYAKANKDNTTTTPVINAGGLGNAPIKRQDGSDPMPRDIRAGAVYPFVWDGTNVRLASTAMAEVPRILSSPILYVRTDGDDNNDGLFNTAARAFKTIQAAIDHAVSTYYLGGRTLTIQLGVAGIYSGFSVSQSVGTLEIRGNVNAPDSYIVASKPGLNNISVSSGLVKLFGVRAKQTQAGFINIEVAYGGSLFIGKVNFEGAPGVTALHVWPGGSVVVTGQLNWVTGGVAAVSVNSGNFTVQLGSGPHTLLNASQWSSAIVVARGSGGNISWNPTYPGTELTGIVNGKRFDVSNQALIDTGGAGLNAYPGNIAGTEGNGGKYV